MKALSIPPSPNWYQSKIIACSDSGQLAYASRETIVWFDDEKNLFSYIPLAHKERITCVEFAPRVAGNKLVSCGEEGVVCIWDLDTHQAILAHIVHTVLTSQQIPTASWSHADPNLVVSADTKGFIVTWDLQTNLTRKFHFKLSFTIVSCNPHNKNIIALGTKTGLLYVMDISGKGQVIHKLRGHDVEIVSLAWCPVRENIFNPGDKETCLLASGARDNAIYFWRTASDGRYEKAIYLPQSPFPDSGHRVQLPGGGSGQHGPWTAVCWPEPGSLVAATPWGELVIYDLLAQTTEPESAENAAGRAGGRKTNNWRLLHGKHGRGLFSIACRPYSVTADDPQADRVLWTVGQDRQIVSCSLSSGKIIHAMSTLGGPVFSMALSPIDGSRLAVGVGDKTIRIWNLSDPNPESMVYLWNKIAGKVYSLAWHPNKEGCLAFGTSDGRIGLYDTMSTKPPTLFHRHFQQAVYVLQWGPNINLRGAIGSGEDEKETNPDERSPPVKKSDYLLYAITDNQACAFDPDNPAAPPVNLKYILRGADAVGKIKMDRKRTGLSWKPDFSLLAIGNEDGSVHFVTPHEPTGLRHVRTVSVHSKLIQDLSWHPASSADEVLPSYANWLAVSSNEFDVRVIDVTNILENVADLKVDASELPVPVVAVLKGHKQRVVNLAWNPHQGGQLLSTSYDETAVIWDVASGQALRNFSEHCGIVLCGLWSPLDADFVLTGAGDSTVRVWQVSSQNEGLPQAKKKARPSFKAKQALPDKSFDTTDVKDTRHIEGSSAIVAKSEESLRQDKKKIKEKSLFPVSGILMNEPTHLLKNLELLIADGGSVSEEKKEKDILPENKEASPKSEEKKLSGNEECCTPAAFFGGKDAVAQLLEKERTALIAAENFENAFTLDLWRSKIKDAVEEATKNHKLSDFIVSLSPMASIKLWQSACLAYAEQLCRSGEYVRSASYYLAVHKVEEAVNMLMENGLSRQAVVIAKSRLAIDDPFIKGVMEKWAEQKLKEGQIEVASNCLASLGEWIEASDVLTRRRNVPHLCVASQLASRGGAHEKAAFIFLDCLKLNNDENWDLLSSCLDKLHGQEHLRLLVAVHQLLLKRLRENIDAELWLKGAFKNEERSFEFDFGGNCSIIGGDEAVIISKRLQLPLLKLLRSGLSLSSRAEALLTVSINLALAITCAPKCFTDLPEGFTYSEDQSEDVHDAVCKLVQAMAALSSYQLRDPSVGHLLFKFCMLLCPKGPAHVSGIFSEGTVVSPAQKSARAYLCTGILNWLMENGSSFIPPEVHDFADRKPPLKARRRGPRQPGTKTDGDNEGNPPDQNAGGTARAINPPTEGTADLITQPTHAAIQKTVQDSMVQSTEETTDTPAKCETEISDQPTVSGIEPADKLDEPKNENIDQPAEPGAEPVDKLAEPKTEPAEQPAQSETEPAKQAAQSKTEPAEQPAQSETEPAKQAAQSKTEPAEQPAQSETEPAQRPAQSETEPAEQPAQSEAEPAEQLAQSEAEPAEQLAQSEAESAKQPAQSETESAKQPAQSETEPVRQPVEAETEPDNQFASHTANHIAEFCTETAAQMTGSTDQIAESFASSPDVAAKSKDDKTNYPKPAWVQALDLIKRYSNDLFSFSNMRYFSDSVRIKVLLHHETSATKEKLDSSSTQADKSENTETEKAEVKTEQSGDSEDKAISVNCVPVLTERQLEIQKLQEWFSNFEKEQVVVPNPFVCYSNLNRILDEILSKVDKEQTETYSEYFKNVWEEAKASHS